MSRFSDLVSTEIKIVNCQVFKCSHHFYAPPIAHITIGEHQGLEFLGLGQSARKFLSAFETKLVPREIKLEKIRQMPLNRINQELAVLGLETIIDEADCGHLKCH
jgi:hypothetical protein